MRIVVNGWFWDQMHVGSGQYLSALAATLPRLGPAHEFVLASPAMRPPAAGLPDGWRLVTAGTPFDRLGENLAKLWFEQVTFPGLCGQLRADVGFVPYWGSPWARPCPMVATIHDLIPLLLPLYRGGPLQRMYTRLVSMTARRASAILTDSEASRRGIVAHLGIPEARVHAVYLATDLCYENSKQPSETEVRARLGLPEGPFLLYLGGFDARKNVVRTMQGYAKLVSRCAAEGRDAPALVIAGKLPATDSAFAPHPRPVLRSLGIVEDALGLAGRVHFTGWVDERDKAALYRMAAGVLFVSEYEGFGLPVLEAMACERD